MTVGSVLITGGTGYIGSFTALALLEADYEVVVVDNLYNSSEEALNRIESICGKRPHFHNIDVRDEAAFDGVFEAHPHIDSVIHFAALKAVGESSDIPLEYYRTNVGGTISLLSSMTRHNVSNIVFSSSATVYGDATRFPNMIPIPEECPIGPTNPYGRTKSTVESIITDHVQAQRNKLKREGKSFDHWNAAVLRYFNPAGSHPSGIMGEDPQGVPYNLLPLLAQVAIGKREKLLVFGDGRTAISHVGFPYGSRLLTPLTVDYDSSDGTAIRDYIHILDLAAGHLVALNYLRDHHPGVRAWNLGTGKGSTVFHMIKAFSAVVGRDLPYEVVGRREGDVLDLTANPRRANEELKWKAERTLEDACADLWRWTENNPLGYRQTPPENLLEALGDRRKKGIVEKAHVNGHGADTNGHAANGHGHSSNGTSVASHSANGDASNREDPKRIKLSSAKDFMEAALSPRSKPDTVEAS
ncbi:MAG: hypothetical protein LQ349_000960 [Xanthoria aureola]|nr:MAG: hypothetical protein LQ349_000960 [Xanthoria aureola]